MIVLVIWSESSHSVPIINYLHVLFSLSFFWKTINERTTRFSLIRNTLCSYHTVCRLGIKSPPLLLPLDRKTFKRVVLLEHTHTHTYTYTLSSSSFSSIFELPKHIYQQIQLSLSSCCSNIVTSTSSVDPMRTAFSSGGIVVGKVTW